MSDKPLTSRDKKGRAYFDDDGSLIRGANGTFHQKKDMTAQIIHQRFVALDKTIDRLAAYEDTGMTPGEVAELARAKSDGRLVLLPCKVGDTVWAITSPVNIVGMASDNEELAIFECTVESITLYTSQTSPPIQFRLYYHGEFVAWYVTVADFGKTVFLTEAEAETALEKEAHDG